MQLFGVAYTNIMPFRIGYSAVSFFFILSGFVLAWSMTPETTRGTSYRRRLARIYPAYLVMLGIAYLFPFPSTQPHVALTTVSALLLVQAWGAAQCPHRLRRESGVMVAEL
jgi:peptidoglycan/LPS O-acetylase OafA/YrhL